MSTWLRYFDFFRRDPRAEASDEIAFHLEMRARDLQARGMSEEQARETAAREFGDAHRVREDVVRIDQRMMRRAERAAFLGELARDIRVGCRALRANPGFAATAILTAALGIGVTAAIVSAAFAILVRPLPYADADRLVAVYSENTVRGYHRTNISWPDFVSWRDENRAFSAMGMYTWSTHALSGEESEAERVQGAYVTANLFQLLGVQPARGRLFLPEEAREGFDQVAVLSDNLWRRRYAADPGIVGKTITVDARPVTVVGVMPPRFSFPDRGELWVPFVPSRTNESHGNRGYAGAIGRLKPGVTFAQAVADLHRIDSALVRQFPEENHGWRAELVTMRDDLIGDLRGPLRVFLWAVALVLLLVCANVANLMLARSALRGREIAVRSALGASRSRLTRQLMTESLLIATLAGTFGIAIAWLGVRLLRFALPGQTPPFYISLGLDGYALAFVAAITVITGLLFGTVPALRGTRVDLNTALRDGSRGASEGLHRSRLRGLLVVAEVGMSIMLMIGAMLLVRSYRNLAGTQLGFDEKGIVSARITLPAANYVNRAASLAFYERLTNRLRTIPGVTVVGTAQGVPFSGWDVQSKTTVEGAPQPRPGEEIDAHYQVVHPDYFKAIGVKLLRGRWLTTTDRDSMAPVVLINETFVAKAFPNSDPLGKRIRIGGYDQEWATVVGVVSDYRHYRLPQPMGPAVFFSYATWPARTQFVVMRTTREDPASLVPALRAAVREIDPRIALYQVQTFEDVVLQSLWRQRLQGNVLAIFAALALVLACIGLYGVIAYAVAQRKRELGVRIALGATRRNVVMLVLEQSGRLVVAGIVVGLLGAFFGARLLESLLYGVKATDPATFATVPLVLVVVALAASVVPARRATRVDPIIAMRED